MKPAPSNMQVPEVTKINFKFCQTSIGHCRCWVSNVTTLRNTAETSTCNFLQYNQLYALISQIYFLNKTLYVSESSSVHHQQFFTVHTAMVYVTLFRLAAETTTIKHVLHNVFYLTPNICELSHLLWGFILPNSAARVTSSVLTLIAICQQTCMTYTIVVCTVKNCWWWTGELSETCSFIPKINLRN